MTYYEKKDIIKLLGRISLRREYHLVSEPDGRKENAMKSNIKPTITVITKNNEKKSYMAVGTCHCN